MERIKRTYLHKGKVRFKRRLPRKFKKKKNKELEKSYQEYKKRLINLHGENWLDYYIIGG